MGAGFFYNLGSMCVGQVERVSDSQQCYIVMGYIIISIKRF